MTARKTFVTLCGKVTSLHVNKCTFDYYYYYYYCCCCCCCVKDALASNQNYQLAMCANTITKSRNVAMSTQCTGASAVAEVAAKETRQAMCVRV